MKTMTPYEWFEEFTETHNKLTDFEFISSFNSLVGLRNWGYGLQGLCMSFKNQFIKRKIDISTMGDGISLKYCVILKDKKIYNITELSKTEVERIFLAYLEQNYPEKLILNPKITEYNNEELHYSMAKHSGVLNVNGMIKKIEIF